MKIKIYGASDDLIELSGDVRDELGGSDEPTYLCFSDGTVIKVQYGPDDSACWRLGAIHFGTATVTKTQTGNDEVDENEDAEAPGYSDVLVLEAEGELSLIRQTTNRERAMQCASTETREVIQATQRIWDVLRMNDCLDSLSEKREESLFDEVQSIVSGLMTKTN